jgi:hypothetical protein
MTLAPRRYKEDTKERFKGKRMVQIPHFAMTSTFN